MLRRMYRIACILTVFCAFFSVPARAELVPATFLQGQGIVIMGSNTMLPLAQLLAEAWMREQPGSVVSVSGGGSSRGIKGVYDGVAQIGLVSSPTESVQEATPKGEQTLVIHRLAQDAVIPVVHPANPVANLSAAQLRAVFSGAVTNWKTLGGTDSPIEVLSHNGTSGTYEAWKERILGDGFVVTPSARILETGPMLRAVAATPASIGYVSYGRLDSSVKPLGIDGVMPDVESIADERFLAVRSLKMVVHPDCPEAVRSFIAFCLDPEKGGTIVGQLGMIPYRPVKQQP